MNSNSSDSTYNITSIAPSLYSSSNKSCQSSHESLKVVTQASSPRQDLIQSFSNPTLPVHKTASNPLSTPHIYLPHKKQRKPPPRPKFISPTRALLDYFDFLTDYERNEISQFEEIYFVGTNPEKLHCNFDDQDGYYIPISGDHLAYRYEIKDILGCGTFGQVFHCHDYKRNIEVAIKIIRNKQIFRKAGDLENKILHELSKADPNDLNCIVKNLRSFEFRGHLCLVFELLSLNLYDFLHKNNFQGLSLQLIRRIAVQLFMALKTVHSVGIIHCDLKPDNILLKYENKSSIKVIDFGSSCQEGHKVYDYIQSRYYRSPEVVLEAGYDKAIDIWSVGCILFELLTGAPLFPAENESELFSMIIEVLGYPPDDLVNLGKRKHYYIDLNGNYKRPTKPSIRPIRKLLENFDENVVGLIESCLKWKPEERIEAEEGLIHGWVKGSKNSFSV